MVFMVVSAGEYAVNVSQTRVAENPPPPRFHSVIVLHWNDTIHTLHCVML